MRSSNPVFARSDEFNGRNAYSNQTYPGAGTYAGYGAPSTWSTGSPTDASAGGSYGQPGYGSPTGQVDQRRMTIDSVVQKTAITLVVLVASAMATWILAGDVTQDTAGALLGLAGMAALVGFGLAMVNSFKRVISPALVLAYAAIEGVFIGGFSKFFEAQYGGIVTSAVLGTLAAFVGTLAAYKVLDIQVTAKFRRGVIAALFAFVAVTLLDFVLSFFGAAVGFNGYGTLGLLFSVLGVVLGVLMLILDFDYVERGVAAGLPERESWRAAFGLTVTLVWLYIEILRILAILRGSD
jgi:uncharacterized YccA/Bax inhibitor family protein